MTFWIIYNLVQIPFLGTALGRFNQCFFFIFRRWPTMVTDISTQPPPPPDKKASYGPVLPWVVENRNFAYNAKRLTGFYMKENL